MMLHLRAHRWALITTTATCLAMVMAVVGGMPIRVGFTAPLQRPLSLVLPVVMVVILVFAVVGAFPALTASGVRRVRSHAAAALIGSVSVPCTAYVAIASLCQRDPAVLSFLTVRNVLGLWGLALLTLWLFTSAWAWVAPVLFVLMCMVGGADSLGHPQVWAWVLDQDTSATASSIAAALFASGLATTVLFTRSLHRRAIG